MLSLVRRARIDVDDLDEIDRENSILFEILLLVRRAKIDDDYLVVIDHEDFILF